MNGEHRNELLKVVGFAAENIKNQLRRNHPILIHPILITDVDMLNEIFGENPHEIENELKLQKLRKIGI